MKYLKQPKFNTKEAETKINDTLNKLEKNIKTIENTAKEKNIYVRIEETREREKVIKELYPFLYNTNRTFNKYGDIKGIVEDILYEYNHRIRTALFNCGFVSINEKTKVIKCKKKYSFGDIDLYSLNHIANFNTNLNNTGKDSESITILKEYGNLNVEFKFKNEDDYNIFKELVFYSNDETEFIINNAPEEVKQEYKEKKKTDYLNEVSVLYSWSKENFKGFSYNSPINTYLINKVWSL